MKTLFSILLAVGLGTGVVMAGWSFRLTWLGWVFIVDVLSRRRRWFRPDPKVNRMFLARDVGIRAVVSAIGELLGLGGGREAAVVGRAGG